MLLVVFWIRMKSLLTDTICIFWSFFVPLILGYAFCLIIPDSQYLEFQPVQVAIVENRESNMELYIAMKQEKTSTGKGMFHVSYCSDLMAKERLKKGEIDAYIVKKNETYTVISNAKDANTIALKTYLENYEKNKGKSTYDKGASYVIPVYAKKEWNKNEIYYLSLIAMTSFYAIFWGVRIANDIEVKQSGIAKRILVSPVAWWGIILENILSVGVIELVMNLVILLTGIYLNHMNFKGRIPEVLLIQVVTSVVGLLSGMVIGKMVTDTYERKMKWCHRIAFVSSFLGGIMFYRMRYMVDTEMPVLGKLSPVNVAADALFHVYFIENKEKYMLDVFTLLLMGAAIGMFWIYASRRKDYERM